MNELLNSPQHKQVLECIESWHDENGNWYRIYSDGFIEQAGIVQGTDSYGTVTVNLHKSFSNTNYIVQCTGQNAVASAYTTNSQGSNRGYYATSGIILNKTTSSFDCSKYFDYAWYACGY